jgi:hypothetical protein
MMQMGAMSKNTRPCGVLSSFLCNINSNQTV